MIATMMKLTQMISITIMELIIKIVMIIIIQIVGDLHSYCTGTS